MMTARLSTKENKKREAILSGNLWKVVLTLTIPLALYQVIIYIDSFIDVWFSSQISSNMMNTIIFADEMKSAFSAFGVSIAIAGSVFIARQYGGGNINQAKKYAGITFTLAAAISTVIVVITTIFAKPLMSVLGASNAIIDTGSDYFIVQMVATLMISLNAVFIGIEKAKGNTQIILWLNLIVLAVKVVLTYTFIVIFHGTLVHMAIASLIAQIILFVTALSISLKSSNSLKLSLSDLNPSHPYSKEILLLALPIFFGRFMFNMGKVVINGLALLYHEFAVAALGVTTKMMAVFLAITAVFEESEIGIISQNIGNNNLKRAQKTFYIAMFYAVVLAVIGLIIGFAAENMLISIFTVNPNEVIIIKDIYVFERYSLVSGAVITTVTGMLTAFKKTKVVFIINILRVFVFRLLTLWLLYTFFEQNRSYIHVGYVMFFSNTLTMLISTVLAIKYMMSLKSSAHELYTVNLL